MHNITLKPITEQETQTDLPAVIQTPDVYHTINLLLATVPDLKMITTIPQVGTYEVKSVKRGPTRQFLVIEIFIEGHCMPIAVHWYQKFELFFSRPAMLVYYEENKK